MTMPVSPAITKWLVTVDGKQRWQAACNCQQWHMTVPAWDTRWLEYEVARHLRTHGGQ